MFLAAHHVRLGLFNYFTQRIKLSTTSIERETIDILTVNSKNTVGFVLKVIAPCCICREVFR